MSERRYEEAKPCPVCGRMPKVRIRIPEVPNWDCNWRVECCTECVRGPERRSRTEAIVAWNQLSCGPPPAIQCPVCGSGGVGMCVGGGELPPRNGLRP